MTSVSTLESYQDELQKLRNGDHFGTGGESVKARLEACLKAGNDFAGADLQGADLREANLADANQKGRQPPKGYAEWRLPPQCFFPQRQP